MKKMLPILLIGILILSGLGAGALNNDKEELDIFSIEYEKSSNNMILRDYTHTVLVEVGSTTTCSACPASNTAWHNIYGSGNYNFEYTEMVVNKNTVANSYMSSRSLYWVPTSYFDGGEYVYPGTNYGTFYNYLDSSGSRPVPDLVATLDAEWLGNAEISISLSIDNNDGSAYPGTLRVFIIELESTLWNDYSGNPYYHAFLGFAFNKAINIPAGGTYSDSTIWNGAAAGYPGITRENTQVILAVFDETPHQSYSNPPSGAPFLAYYVDETIAVIPEIQNSSPYVPSNPYPENGSTNVDVDTILSWTGGDPDPGDTVTYDVYFGTSSPPLKVVGNQSANIYNPGTLDYETTHYWQIVDWDSYGAFSEGPIWSFTTIGIPPEISNVTLTTSDPLDTEIGWENFSCTVTDISGVDKVKLVLIGDATTEYSMNKDDDDYYCNITIEIADEYTYHIWANDTSDNYAESAFDMFNLPLNADVNEDGSVGFVDIMMVAGMWNALGPNGWDRADVDNNGEVGFVDVMMVAGQWGQEW